MAKKAKARARSKAKSKAKSSLMTPSDLELAYLSESLWPLERDVMFRPERFKYVRKLIPQEGCVFCVAAHEPASFETLAIHKTEHAMVVLNKYPYNNGHVMVLPLRHCGDLTKLKKEEYLDVMLLLQRTMSILTETYRCPGMNVGLNHGASAGAGIPEHLHFHLIPRWPGDVNFFPLIAQTKVVVETLEQTYDRIKTAFEK